MATWNNRQLLCTFCNNKNIDGTIKSIKKTYVDFNDKIFVFANLKNPTEIYLTYNIINNVSKLPNTILIHRKKEFNTLYTINSLNQLIRDENGGVLDKKYIVQWDLYRDSLIINGEVSVNIIELKLLQIEH